MPVVDGKPVPEGTEAEKEPLVTNGDALARKSVEGEDSTDTPAATAAPAS